jgi:hypothetical protein
LRRNGNGRWAFGFGIAGWEGVADVALRNTCNTLQQSATKLIINTLTTDNILPLTKPCQWFCSFIAKKFVCYAGLSRMLEPAGCS